MRIQSSSVSLAASVTRAATEVRTERVLGWIGDPPPAEGARRSAPVDRERATPAVPALPALGEGPATPAIPAVPADPAHPSQGEPGGEVGEVLSGRDQIELLILRRTFRLDELGGAGRAIRRAYAEGAAQAAATGRELAETSASAQQGSAPAPARAGWGLEVEVSVARTERTTVAFAATAAVTTADGRQIVTAAALEMERVSASTTEVQLRAGDRRVQDPLAVNLTGAPVAFAGTQQLDLDGDGAVEEVAQLAAGSAWLARDLDGSGAIESGGELFGPASGDGFGELASLDEDGNGWVDEGDRAFATLALWDGARLTSLGAAGIGALYTGAAATPFAVSDASGSEAGQVRATGLYLREDGSAGTVQHVDLMV